MLLYRFGSLATGRDLHSNRNGLCLQDLQLVVWSNRYRKSMRKAVGVFLMCCSWLEHRANNTKAAYSLQNWTWLFLWVSIYNKLRDKSIWANSEVSGVAAEPCRPYLSDDHLSPGPAQPAVTAVVSSVTGQRRAGLGNGARGGCPESVSKEGVQSHSQGRCPTAHAQGGCPDPIPKQGVQSPFPSRVSRAGSRREWPGRPGQVTISSRCPLCGADPPCCPDLRLLTAPQSRVGLRAAFTKLSMVTWISCSFKDSCSGPFQQINPCLVVSPLPS